MNHKKSISMKHALLALLLLGSAGLRGAADDPFPDVNPHGYYGSMIMTAKVTMDEEVYTQDVVLAVYAADQIRGKGCPSDSNHSGAIYLDVYGDEGGEQLYFKISVHGHLLEIHPDLTWQFNAVVGTPQAPYILDIGDRVPRREPTCTEPGSIAYWQRIDGRLFADVDFQTELTPQQLTISPLGHDYGSDGSCTRCGQHSYEGIRVSTTDGKHTVIFEDNSEQTVSIPLPITASAVVYNRRFEPGKPMGIFLPFAITEEMNVSGGKFYHFTDITRKDDKWVATMTQVKELEANMPYLIMPDADHLSIEVLGQQVIVQTEAKSPATINDWSLCGTYEKMVWHELSTDYGFPAREYESGLPHRFVRLTTDDYILPLHCYLSYRGSLSTSAPPFSSQSFVPPHRLSKHEMPESIEVVFVDEYDAIRSYEANEANGANGINGKNTLLDLSGRSTVQSYNRQIPHGVYIYKGKKVVIKK